MDDYQELIERLESRTELGLTLNKEAANAIESLKAEVLRLTVALSETEALEMSHGERIENLYGHIAELYVGYVRLMENGRDRIIMLGGDCDSVDFMEANDPLLINIRNVMKK